MKKILEVKNLSLSFNTHAGNIQAVRDISFDLYKGETLAIVGESGSGKSVTTKALMNFVPNNGIILDDSQILLNEYEDNKLANTIEINKLKERTLQNNIRGKKIAMIFQDPMTSLNPTMTIGKQIMEAILENRKMTKKEAKEETYKLIDLVGISDSKKRFKQYPHQFSGGMRQRIVIAIALSCTPNVLICDEPTTALDVTIQAQILELLNDIKRKIDLSIIFITHDLGVVANMADRVAVMYAGKIVEIGKVNEIFYEPAHPYTWGLLASMPDLESEGELYAIPGTPPNLLQPPKGDAFALRSDHALEIDFLEQPPQFKISDTHFASTWLLHEYAEKIEMPKPLKERIDLLRKKWGLDDNE